VGLTSDLEARLFRHNNGYERTTKPYAPFRLIHDFYLRRSYFLNRAFFILISLQLQFLATIPATGLHILVTFARMISTDQINELDGRLEALRGYL
jgi:hypothetical protein